jgi:hypothetical protein
MKGREFSCAIRQGLRLSELGSSFSPDRVNTGPLKNFGPTHPLPFLSISSLSVPFGSTRSSLTAQPRFSGTFSEAPELLPHFMTDFVFVQK